MSVRATTVGSNKRRASSTIRLFPIGGGEFTLSSVQEEIDVMRDVLMGRRPPPIDVGVSTLLEVAEAYYARLVDIAITIKRAESEGRVKSGSPWYKFRTGELRMMLELTSRSANLGSRRITAEQLRRDKERTGRESYR